MNECKICLNKNQSVDTFREMRRFLKIVEIQPIRLYQWICRSLWSLRRGKAFEL